MKKILLLVAMGLCSTSALAGTSDVTCIMGDKTITYKAADVKRAFVNYHGTNVVLNNGKDIYFSPAVQCMVEEV